mgnify:CR=1 FL=1
MGFDHIQFSIIEWTFIDNTVWVGIEYIVDAIAHNISYQLLVNDQSSERVLEKDRWGGDDQLSVFKGD